MLRCPNGSYLFFTYNLHPPPATHTSIHLGTTALFHKHDSRTVLETGVQQQANLTNSRPIGVSGTQAGFLMGTAGEKTKAAGEGLEPFGKRPSRNTSWQK